MSEWLMLFSFTGIGLGIRWWIGHQKKIRTTYEQTYDLLNKDLAQKDRTIARQDLVILSYRQTLKELKDLYKMMEKDRDTWRDEHRWALVKEKQIRKELYEKFGLTSENMTEKE